MATQDPLNPNSSPNKLITGTRNVNNIPIYLVGGLVLIFLLVMIKVAHDRSEQQNKAADPTPQKVESSTSFAQSIAGDAQGMIPPQPTDSTPVLIATQGNLDAPPTPPGLTPPAGIQPTGPANAAMGPTQDDQAIQFQNIKNQQFVEAVRSKTAVRSDLQRGNPGTSAQTAQTRDEMITKIAAVRQQINETYRDNPNASYQEKLAQLQGTAGGAGATTNGQPANQAGAPRTSYAQYAGSGQTDRWKLDAQVEKPRTPFELRAGFVIPATLVSGINSELPGQILGQVSQDVWDTPTGKHLLIPQGSRLVGTYSSDVTYGQARVLVAWQRILFPDGKAFDIGSMPGTDSAGYSGFKDQVNNHYLRIFGSALLLSGVTAGITYSQRDNQNPVGVNQNSASGALSEALGQQLGQVTAQMISKNMNVSPTLEIRPGFRFNVIVTKDMTFPSPYRAEY